MSVTALDLSVVTIESLVAQDISAFSLRRLRGGSTQASSSRAATVPVEQPVAAVPLVLAAAATTPAATLAPVPVTAPVPAHPHRAPSARRLAQVH